MSHKWNSYPMNSEVHWPRDEKIIGVLGVAPHATVDFYQKLCAMKAEKDWQYPRVIIDSNPKIPSRGRYLELGETDPVPFLRKGIASLAAMGADVVAVPCNTAHILYPRYAKGSPVLLPSIVDVTVQACLKMAVKKVLVLGSRLTISHQLYQDAFKRLGLASVVPDSAGQKLVGECIEQVKRNGPVKELRKKLIKLVVEVDAHAVVLACTELPVILNTPLKDKKVVDSSTALAEFCLSYALGPSSFSPPGEENLQPWNRAF